MTATIAGIGQVSLVIKDLERATNFYRDVVGLEHLFMAGGMSFFNMDGVRLLLCPAGGDVAHGSSILYYRVGDIESGHRRFVEAGVEVLGLPHEVFRQQGHSLWLAFYADSEGNAFALMEETRDD